MANAGEKSSKLSYMVKKIEKNSTSVEDKCKDVSSALQELKQACAQAICGINEKTKERNKIRENMKYEQCWKLKIIQWEDSKRRDIKSLEEDLQLLKERVDKRHPFPMTKQVHTRLVNKYLRQGLAIAVAGIVGITATVAAFF